MILIPQVLHFTLKNNNSPKIKPMKQFFFATLATLLISINVIAQINQYSPGSYATGLYIIDKDGNNRKLVLNGTRLSPA